MEIYNGYLNSAMDAIYNNTGEMIIYNGTIEGENNGIYNKSGNVTVLGGTIKNRYAYGSNDSAIYNESGTITLGTKDGQYMLTPELISNANGIYNSKGTFNFYDGKIESKESKSINGDISNIEKDYNIKSYKNGESDEFPVQSGKEITILKQTETVMLESNGTKYASIDTALIDALDTDKIILLQNINILQTKDSLNIQQGKNITIDLAGYEVSCGNEDTIVNNGTLKFTDSSDAKASKITNLSNRLIVNYGTLTLETITVDGQKNSSDQNLEFVYNEGTLNIEGATLNASYYLIKNVEDGSLNITSGNLNTAYNKPIIYSNSTGNIDISGGYIGMGYIQCSNSETLNITGGTIDNSSYGSININNLSKICISGNSTINKSIYVNNNSSIEVNGGTYYFVQLNNSAKATVNGGKSSDISFRSYSTGNIVINGGEIGALDDCVNNNVTINGGSIKGITNQSGIITINDGTISGSGVTGNVAIKNKNNGTIVINKAIIQATENAIENSSGTIIVGTNDGEVNNLNVEITSINGVGIKNSDTFKYYDGTIKGKGQAINGKINEIEQNAIINLQFADETETATIQANEIIAQIGETEYTNLNTAIEEFNESTHEEITIINNFAITEKDKIVIDEEKNVTINLNGHTITAFTANNTITNNGTLKLKDGSTNGLISSRSSTIISNVGTLEINSGTYESISYSIINRGIFTLTNAKIKGQYGIHNDSLGQTYINNGAIITLNDGTYGIALYNQSGKIIINNDTEINADKSSYMSAIRNEQAGEIEINGGTVSSGGNITNNGTFTINDGIIEIKTNGSHIENISYGTIKMIGGTINSEGNGISNSSGNSATIEGGTITAKQIAIISSGNTIISGGNIISQNSTAIRNNGGRVTITGGIVTSQTEIAIQNYAILTLGKNDGNKPDLTNPQITGKTYGVSNNSEFNFYDGIIIGETDAISGNVTGKPDGYIVNVQTEENKYKATLKIEAFVENTIMVNGIVQSSIEDAIDTITNLTSKTGTIVLNGDVALERQQIIPSEINVTIALQGHSITYDGTDAAIVNNGVLTIIDYVDNSEVLDTGEESIVRNTNGTAITNNGTLTLGITGDPTNANSPRIIGGVTGNAPIIYDGKVD